jgi:SAM-dependent methyltransferase
MRDFIRNLFYPGLDLHTRNRASLCKYWKTGPRDVLDAGSGNGYFSWLAYKSGARVIAINFDETQVKKSREFLVGYKKADPTRLQFEQRNLYDLPAEIRTFDEIICFEVLEHLRRDCDVVREFYRLLRPGGVLHVCCPFRMHPRHQAEMLDLNETGFQVLEVVGIGTPGIYHADRILRAIRNRVGDLLAIPLLLPALMFVKLAKFNPRVPFSLYARVIKPEKLP